MNKRTIKIDVMAGQRRTAKRQRLGVLLTVGALMTLAAWESAPLTLLAVIAAGAWALLAYVLHRESSTEYRRNTHN